MEPRLCLLATGGLLKNPEFVTAGEDADNELGHPFIRSAHSRCGGMGRGGYKVIASISAC